MTDEEEMALATLLGFEGRWNNAEEDIQFYKSKVSQWMHKAPLNTGTTVEKWRRWLDDGGYAKGLASRASKLLSAAAHHVKGPTEFGMWNAGHEAVHAKWQLPNGSYQWIIRRGELPWPGVAVRRFIAFDDELDNDGPINLHSRYIHTAQAALNDLKRYVR